MDEKEFLKFESLMSMKAVQTALFAHKTIGPSIHPNLSHGLTIMLDQWRKKIYQTQKILRLEYLAMECEMTKSLANYLSPHLHFPRLSGGKKP
jgi:hypothetical protein